MNSSHILDKIVSLFLVIAGPFLAGINLAYLCHNPKYDAQPWKVVLAVAMALGGAARLAFIHVQETKKK